MIEISTDWCGWPVYAKTLKEVLEGLGFTLDNTGKYLQIDANNELLNAYPRLLTDDGMGYGVCPRYIVEEDKELYEQTIGNKPAKVFNLFREKDLTASDEN